MPTSYGLNYTPEPIEDEFFRLNVISTYVPFILKACAKTDVWVGQMIEAPRVTYGPERKGRGGKIKKW